MTGYISTEQRQKDTTKNRLNNSKGNYLQGQIKNSTTRSLDDKNRQ